MVMGTASTVACMVEALGMCCPAAAACRRSTADRMRIAEASGAAGGRGWRAEG